MRAFSFRAWISFKEIIPADIITNDMEAMMIMAVSGILIRKREISMADTTIAHPAHSIMVAFFSDICISFLDISVPGAAPGDYITPITVKIIFIIQRDRAASKRGTRRRSQCHFWFAPETSTILA